jgi:hypothetical protein
VQWPLRDRNGRFYFWALLCGQKPVPRENDARREDSEGLESRWIDSEASRARTGRAFRLQIEYDHAAFLIHHEDAAWGRINEGAKGNVLFTRDSRFMANSPSQEGTVWRKKKG